MYRLETPVVGYRLWYTRRSVFSIEEGRELVPGLFSISVQVRWDKGMNVAECKPILPFAGEVFRHPDCSPSKQCLCGLHGGARPENIDRWVYNNGLTPHIMGAILMGGQMYSGGQIIRTQKAQVICLLRSAIHLSANDRAEEYGVPLCNSVEHMRYVATDYGDELTKRQIEELQSA